MTNIKTCSIAMLFLSLAACVDVDADDGVGTLRYGVAWTEAPPDAEASSWVECPSPLSGPALWSQLCSYPGCDPSALEILDQPGEWAEVGPKTYVDITVTPAEWNACNLLPDDGPCALACDRDALAAAWVPATACVVFVCPLTDGTTLVTHACTP